MYGEVRADSERKADAVGVGCGVADAGVICGREGGLVGVCSGGVGGWDGARGEGREGRAKADLLCVKVAVSATSGILRLRSSSTPVPRTSSATPTFAFPKTEMLEEIFSLTSIGPVDQIGTQPE